MTEEHTIISPISGGNAPYRDLGESPSKPVDPRKTAASPTDANLDKKVKNLKIWIIGLGGVLVIVLIALVAVLFILSTNPDTGKKPAQPVAVTPTPAATNELSSTKNHRERVSKLEQDVKTVDLQELEVVYPQLDWEITY